MPVNSLPDTVSLAPDGRSVLIIDQTLLPGRLSVAELSEEDEMCEAITSLRVRGAPAIGVFAAYALSLLSAKTETENPEVFDAEAARICAHIASTRPTAVNLFHALSLVSGAAGRESGVAAKKAAMAAAAHALCRYEINASEKMGEYGLSLLRDGMGIMTHCNAGALATVRLGTALAPIHLGARRGFHFHVYADETRPLLQGARLTAYELCADGIDVTVQCDGMAASLMAAGKIDAVITGADRIAANGDVCNKIGTCGAAIIAKHYSVPFYVIAPVSTFDKSCASGSEITIEQRSGDEVSSLWYSQQMTPDGVNIYNPAFDVTPASLITAIVTEKGILYPPFGASAASL